MNSPESPQNSSTDSVSEQRYLIAQYAADRRRMETRNVGVILWAAGNAEAMFLPDSDAAEIVSDLAVYRRWIDFWHKKIYSEKLRLPGQAEVRRSDPSFVDALLQTQKGNYLLFDAGFVAEPIAKGRLAAATGFLFDELVAEPAAQASVIERDSLQSIAERAFAEAGVDSRDDFQAQYQISCKVFGVEQPLTVNYALANDSAEAVFQRVALKQQSVLGTATMFYSLVDSKKLRSKKRCASLIDIAEEQKDKPSILKFTRMLRRVSEVIDLSDSKTAVEQIRDISKAA